MRMAQRGKRCQGRSTKSAQTAKTARLAQYRPGLFGPGGRAALAWATAASPMKIDARTKNWRRPRSARALPSCSFMTSPDGARSTTCLEPRPITQPTVIEPKVQNVEDLRARPPNCDRLATSSAEWVGDQSEADE